MFDKTTATVYSIVMKILIICSSNICRSPFAEYYLKKLVDNDDILRNNIEWIKSSAVLNKSKQIHPKAAIALQKEGFFWEEIQAHKPAFVHADRAPFVDADIIIGMSKMHKILLPRKFRKKFVTLSTLALGKYIKIPDPFLLKSQERYNEAMEPIKHYLDIFANNLKEQFLSKK